MYAINRLLNVPSTDPDDARRRKLLNILLLSLAIVGVLSLLAAIIADFIGLAGLNWERQDRITAYLGGLALLFGVLIIFVVNRYGPGWVASTVLLVFLIIAVPFFDEPQEVAGGRSLLMFSIPIMMGSVLLPSYASFIMAGLSSLMLIAVALSLRWVPNPFAMLTFFVLALVSWLSARSLEQALQDLRAINRELDQRVAERTRDLAEALSKNQAILEGIADGVIVFDYDGQATVANRSMARLMGRPAEEITGRDIDALMQIDVAPADQEKVHDLLRDKEVSHLGLKLPWGRKTLSVSLAPVRDDSGGTTGTVAVFRDFTREAELERMKSAFVSMVSHELRTPLSAIMGYVDMLQEGVYGKLLDKQRNVAERIMANTKRLLGLVNNLLDQAQIEAGRLKLNITSFDPVDLVGEMQSVMGVLARNQGLKLVSDIAEDVPATLSGDWQRLHQIMINLVGNAIKFTEQGTVHVGIYRFDATHWALEVSDTGRGIPPEAQSYIFEPFRQADDSVTREYTGSGLGLAIVKQLTAMMGGEIRLDSEVGRGSVFTIILPLTPPATEGVEGAKSNSGLAPRRRYLE